MLSTEALNIPDITKTESNNFKENNDKRNDLSVFRLLIE